MMHCLVNPLWLFLLVWSGALVLYLGGVCQGLFSPPRTLTVAAVLLNVVTFTLGYLTWTLFRDLDPARPEPPAGPGRPLTSRAMARSLRFTLAMGLAALGLEMVRVVAIAQRFGTTWIDLVTHPDLFRVRIVTFINESLSQTSGIAMLLSVTSSLFSIGFVFLGIRLYVDRTRRKYLYLFAFLAISLTIGLIHLSRYEVTSNILYLVLAYCLVGRLDRSRGWEQSAAPGARAGHLGLRTSSLKLLTPLAALVLLFGLIDILLHKSGGYGLSGWLQGRLFHFYWYIAAPLAAFNEFVATFNGDHQWGQNMFLPLYKWLWRLQLAPQIEVNFYGEKVWVPYMSNVYTYLRSFYQDFGIVGVAVAPYVLGGAVAAVRTQARRHFQYLNLYLVLLLFILFSFYNYFLSSNQIYLQVLFGFLLFRYDVSGIGECPSFASTSGESARVIPGTLPVQETSGKTGNP